MVGTATMDRGCPSPNLLHISDYIRPRAGSDPLAHKPTKKRDKLKQTHERLSGEEIHVVEIGDCGEALDEFRLWLKSRSTEVYSSDSSLPGASDHHGDSGQRTVSESGAHGHLNPLSWDNIASPLQTAIMNPGVQTSQTTDTGEEKKKRRSRHITRPKGSIEYTVGDRDSLASVAAHFDTTCSEIKKLNKLMSSMIYPGQTLYLPDKDYVPSPTPTPPSSPVHSPIHSKTDLPVIKMSSKGHGPGHAERLPSDPPPHSPAVKKLSHEEAQHLDEECMERFIKIMVKHITDGQGVVNGVLLVTPNAVMFDPNVSDPLVVDRGPDMYGMIAPMETIISAAIYTDIAAMKVKTSPKEENAPNIKPTVYHVEDCPLSKCEPISEEREDDVFHTRTRNDSICSCNMDIKTDAKTETLSTLEESLDTSAGCQSSASDKTDGAECASSAKSDHQADISCSTNSEHQAGGAASGTADEGLSNNNSQNTLLPPSPATHIASASDGSTDKHAPSGGDGGTDKSVPAGGGNNDDNNEQTGIFRRTLGSISSIGSFAGSQIVDFSSGLFTRGQDDKDRVKDVSETGDDAMETDEKKKHVENVVKLRDRPELFKSLDELIPRPATLYEDPPMYLCLKVGKLLKMKSRTCPIPAYTRSQKPEYWFSIPREKVDPLYSFFVQWSPSIYGEDPEFDPAERGFVVLDEAQPLPEAEDFDTIELVDDHFNKYRERKMSKGWEIVNKEEITRRKMSLLDDDNLPLPDLNEPSNLLNDNHISVLSKNLPPRAVGYTWDLVYSSDRNGFSLKTLYRQSTRVESQINLLIVKDTKNQIFGAILSSSIHMSDHFYGTGESFLFTFYPQFKKFPWTGSNNFFTKGNPDSLSIGGGEGTFGLWLDGDLYHGRTSNCQTYDNDVLTEQEDFVVKGIEVWKFTN